MRRTLHSFHVVVVRFAGPCCGTTIRGVVRFIVGVSGYLGLVFSSFIHRVFHFRGNSRRIRCRDSSGAFVP
jgi:hypothetical protein